MSKFRVKEFWDNHHKKTIFFPEEKRWWHWHSLTSSLWANDKESGVSYSSWDYRDKEYCVAAFDSLEKANEYLRFYILNKEIERKGKLKSDADHKIQTIKWNLDVKLSKIKYHKWDGKV